MPVTAGNNPVVTPRVGPTGVIAKSPSSAGARDTSGDQAKIADFEAWLDAPPRIKAILDRAQKLRDWMDVVLMQDVPNTVVTHHTLRYIQADLAMLTATNPQGNFKPKPKFWEKNPAAPNLCPAPVKRFAETVEYLTNFFAQNGKLRDAANAAARDAKTTRAGWVKLIWRDDPARTPTGAAIHDPMLNASFRLAYLRREYAEGCFGQDSPDYKSMMELDRYMRGELVTQLRQNQKAPEAVAVDQDGATAIVASEDPATIRINELLAGKPIKDEEIADAPRFLGFDFDVVDIEDMRLDWTIDRPEHYARSRRIGQRTRMRTHTIVEKYQLNSDQAAMVANVTDEPSNSGDQDSKRNDGADPGADTPNNASDGMQDVWEIWDQDDRCVYVMMVGVPFFLNTFTPRNVGPHWFPFFYLWFNEMSGFMYAPCDVELLRPLQNEINDIRTHAREYRKAAMPRLFIAKGAMNDVEKLAFENSHPFQVIEVEKPDDIAKSLMPFAGVTFNPALVTISEPMMEMQIIAGMPTSGLGGVGSAKLATEVSFASQQLQTQQERKQFLFTKFLADILWEMAHIVIRALPYENAVDICGPGLQFPVNIEEREKLLAETWLDVVVSPTGKPDVEKEIGHLSMISQIMREHGMTMSPLWLCARLSEIQGEATDWQSAVIAQDPNNAAAPSARRAGPGGAPSGPKPGTPGGGQGGTPNPSSLPGNAPPVG